MRLVEHIKVLLSIPLARLKLAGLEHKIASRKRHISDVRELEAGIFILNKQLEFCREDRNRLEERSRDMVSNKFVANLRAHCKTLKCECEEWKDKCADLRSRILSSGGSGPIQVEVTMKSVVVADKGVPS